MRLSVSVKIFPEHEETLSTAKKTKKAIQTQAMESEKASWQFFKRNKKVRSEKS